MKGNWDTNSIRWFIEFSSSHHLSRFMSLMTCYKGIIGKVVIALFGCVIVLGIIAVVAGG
jgi:hypothetical protein